MLPFKVGEDTVPNPIHPSPVFTEKWITGDMNVKEPATLPTPSCRQKWARSQRVGRSPGCHSTFSLPPLQKVTWILPSSMWLKERSWIPPFFGNFNDLHCSWEDLLDLAWSQFCAVSSHAPRSTNAARWDKGEPHTELPSPQPHTPSTAHWGGGREQVVTRGIFHFS